MRASRNASSAIWNHCATPRIRLSDGSLLSSCGLYSSWQPIWNHRQIVEANAGGVEDGVTDGRRHGHDGRFSGTGRRQIFAIKQDGFDFRNIAESRYAIVREMRILDAAVFEFDGFEERAAQTLNHRADDLVAQSVGIDDGAAFECFHQANDAHGAGYAVDGYFRTGDHVAAFLVATRKTAAFAPWNFLLRIPAEGFRSGVQDGA